MAGEKYIIAASENQVQIAIRNILNPFGYVFLDNCEDPITLLRLIWSYHPDFIVVDINMQMHGLRSTLETIDDELLCSCIVICNYGDVEIANLLEKTKVISSCPKPVNREILLHTVEIANINYRRVSELTKKLREMTENFETRKAVERAKRILMDKHRVSEKEAYERIRKKSMDSRMSMKDISDSIIFADEIIGKG